MKKYLITIIISLTSMIFVNCYAQSNKMKLSDNIQLTYKDLLDLKLQILATQMTCGSYRIIDMGRITFPVSITINDQNKIVFEIEGDMNSQYSKETHKKIMSEAFLFVKVGITELIGGYFPQLDFDYSNNIIGYWYYKNAHGPCAKWENEKFDWLNH